MAPVNSPTAAIFFIVAGSVVIATATSLTEGKPRLPAAAWRSQDPYHAWPWHMACARPKTCKHGDHDRRDQTPRGTGSDRDRRRDGNRLRGGRGLGGARRRGADRRPARRRGRRR